MTSTLQRALATLLFPAALGADERPLSFNRDIRPILSENCFACHGFDAKKREADLRLDLAEGAFADLGGYQAIQPGDPMKSEAWRRILATERDHASAEVAQDPHRRAKGHSPALDRGGCAL